MRIRRFLAVCGASAMVGLITAAGALAAGPRVSVRVEGVRHTLLRARHVHAGSGWITKGRTPKGVCPARSAAGALNAATHHRWRGTYSSGLGIEITSILGETHRYSPRGYYWGIWVNNRYASAGVCDLHLHRGEQLLFAPYPGTGTTAPIVLSAPHRVRAGHRFTVHVTSYRNGRRARPLAGVRLTGGAVTNRRGIARITAHHKGRLRLVARRAGYIRDEATVKVAA